VYANQAEYRGITAFNKSQQRSKAKSDVGVTHEEPPSPVTQQSGEDDAAPRPVDNIPHPFCQTLGFKVLSSPFQFPAIGTFGVCRATDTLKPELNKQGGERQDQVCPEGTAHKGETEEKVEAMDTQCDQMGALENGGIAGCLCFESLLLRLFR
jgi:hypothetical protein